MKKLIVLVQGVLVAISSFALTETVNGVTWHYRKSGNDAIIESPNIRKLQSVSTFSLLPAHEGPLPKILRIPEKLGGMNVYAIAMGAIQLSNDSGVELIVIPETVQGGISGHAAVVGEFIRCEYFSSSWTSSTRRYKWFFKNASEHGLKGVLFLGNKHYRAWPYNSGYDVIYLPNNTDEIIFSAESGMDGLWPQVYYVEGACEPSSTEVAEYGVLYGTAKVEVKPDNRLFDETISVSLSCTNKTAKIYYTVDGSDPTTNQTANCFLYDGPFSITHRTQVKALAYVAEYPYQVVYSNEYAFGQTATPIMTAADGEVFNWSGNVVTLSCETGDVEIRYTLDGSEPTERSLLYTAPFAIDDTTTVKAKAFKEDWFESETATATFTREWYTVATPVIEPGSMTFENVSQVVSISCATEGATILYTTDGSDPASNGLGYRKPFSVYSSCTVRTVAVKDDWKNSQVATSTLSRSESLSEAANLYGYTMETDETHPWTVVTDVSHDGVSSVRSGEIGNGGTTYLQTSVRKAGTVSFWWKAQCEEADEEEGEDGYYDYGAFLVDGVVKARIAGHDTGWQYVSADVAGGGKHTLRWEYSKDGATSYAPDCVWLDQVQWTPSDGSGFTMTSPEPVPYSWLSKYGFGGRDADFETAANASSGKCDGGGKALSVWQDYVAGTDPTNVTSRFTAKIEMRGSEPIVTWEPDLNENGTKSERLYKIYGSETLDGGGEWQYPTNSLHRFFKVTVEMP